MYDLIAQAIGLVAMAFIVLSFQQKTPRRAIVFQMLGCILFSVNFGMLGALVGMCLDIIGTFRALVYSNREKFHADHPGWLVFFILLYLISYVLNFTLFGVEFTLGRGALELLPVIGMTATTISFRLQNTKLIRLFGFISSPCWLTYNLVNMAVGGVICEVFSLCSIVIGLIRYDLKPSKKA